MRDLIPGAIGAAIALGVVSIAMFEIGVRRLSKPNSTYRTAELFVFVLMFAVIALVGYVGTFHRHDTPSWFNPICLVVFILLTLWATLIAIFAGRVGNSRGSNDNQTS